VATTGVILAAVYLLWAVQRAFTGEPDEKNVATREIGFRELCTVVPLLGLSLFLGFYPKPVLDRIQPSVDALVTQVDSHSNHHKPAVNYTSEECLPDARGRYTISVRSFAAAQRKPGQSITLILPGLPKPCNASEVSK
jgi:NADH:ubiquinone oxidoreductase subunit 5 (subunit L)/multisubunit Na+/H+ antiporter MnhA subunit